MNEEIREALKIIKEPITVNCIEYKYFDQENYDKITRVYDNCLWFANNLEQINLTVENLEKENQKLKSQLQQRDEVINKAKEYIKNHKRNLIHEITHEEYEMLDDENIINLLKILDNKGDES